MEQQKIKYRTIMDLGFTEEICSDSNYFDQFGFDYSIINKELTDTIYLDWAKETQLCELIRIDKPDGHNIKKRMPINDLEELIKVLDFFSDKTSKPFNPNNYA